VTDQSRRTIVGAGKVLVAREPFQVTAWVDRGYYRVGDTVEAHFIAQTIAHEPVAGDGALTLYRVTYDADGAPQETEVAQWDVDPDADGRATQKLQASQAGQYRLSYVVTDAAGRRQEGGYLFLVRGEGFDGREFRFNQVELLTEQREYAPGETVRVSVNTERAGSTVLLFVRPTNGIYLPPRVLRLEGKSTVATIDVAKKDMPNFFVEAVTVADGRVHSRTREIVVPPEKRVLNVEVLPDREQLKPGAVATVQLRLTDFFGKPYQGSTVVTVYDKSVEYISGGGNVPEIRAHFWKWRRHHSPATASNLERWFQIIVKQNETTMQNLGVFGHLAADHDDRSRLKKQENRGRGAALPQAAKAGRAMSLGADMSAADDALMETEAAAAPMEEIADVADKAGPGAPGGGETVEPTVRRNFADTAFWVAALETDADGVATIEVPMPEQLTTWKIRTWAMGQGTRVGQGAAEVITKKNLIIRLQAPRFFTQYDEAVLSANIHNYLETEKAVEAVLELEGALAPTENLPAPADGVWRLTKQVTVPAGGETRVDWRVRAAEEGEGVVRMKALTDEESDAMEQTFPVLVHGMEKLVPQCGLLRPDEETARITIDVPADRRVNESRLEVRYSPTLALAMIDALPYLVEYPYGCTEQTLNRFLPTVITQNMLLRMGVDLADVRDKRVNLNAQELGDAAERAEQWKKHNLRRGPDGTLVPRNPVWDEAEVDRMVKRGVEDLQRMQNADGGWGWWGGHGSRSGAHTTAVVVHGLLLAQENDIALLPGVLDRSLAWMEQHEARQVKRLREWDQKPRPRTAKRYADNTDALVHTVLAEAGRKENAAMRSFLYRDRTHLSVYAKCAFALALHARDRTEERDMLRRNVEQVLVQDEENQTAWLNLDNGHYWWAWYGSEMEAHAWYLKLLSAVDPEGPVAPRLVKYLLNNRKHATYWNSTRDTAYVIEAFADYIRATGEDRPDLTLTILVDGKPQKEVTINRENLFTFDNRFVLFGDAVETGRHTIELRKTGTGPLYFNAYLSYFSLEKHIPAAGLEVKVRRDVYRLRRVDASAHVAAAHGQAVEQKVEKYERVPVEDGGTLQSGDLLEVELVIESKNDYEYLVFEDWKAAGCEPVRVRSGYTGNAMGAYVEFRDEKVAFFVERLARGAHSVSYRLRAEVPGVYSALPARGYAMYAPELKGNSDEIKLRIED
ncbi:MAG: alpha-2-macroglobulin family protein, partial [Planctomycetota bacterium]